MGNYRINDLASSTNNMAKNTRRAQRLRDLTDRSTYSTV